MFIVLKKKIIIAVAACILTIIAIPVAIHYTNNAAEAVQASTSANTNWGLSFPKDGGTPTGNASSEFLQQYNSFYVGDTSKKEVYITFDAGYENGYTPAILDTLKKHNVKATFFVVGNYIETSPELGYKSVFWSLAYVDWYLDNQPTREEALEKLLPRVHPGAVILLHSTSKTNAEILDEFLTTLEEQGYTFGTLNDIV